jgi:MFS family permease
MATLTAASSAPSPLYPVYQADFGFSAVTLTVIFAVYVFALLASLLTVARLSDYAGRRVVLAGSLAVEAASMALFLAADGVGWLVVARVVQGLATGAAIGTLAAYLLDLQPPDASRLGSLVNSAAPTFGLGRCAALAAGTGFFLLALGWSSIGLFVAASVVAGAGFGSAFLGSLRSVSQLAEANQRAGLLSAVYVVSYLAFSIPALAAGLLATHVGLRDTSFSYGVFVAVIAVGTLAYERLATRKRSPR